MAHGYACTRYPYPACDLPDLGGVAEAYVRSYERWKIGRDREFATIIVPRHLKPGSTLTVNVHGYVPSGESLSGPPVDQQKTGIPNSQYLYTAYAVCAATQGPVIAPAAGGGFTWGNDSMLNSVDGWHEWTVEQLGCRPDKINIFGASMGGLNTLVYAMHRSEKVGCAYAQVPACDPYDFYINNRLTAAIAPLVRGDMRSAFGNIPTADAAPRQAAPSNWAQLMDAWENDHRMPWHRQNGNPPGEPPVLSDDHASFGFAKDLARAGVPLMIGYTPNDQVTMEQPIRHFIEAYLDRDFLTAGGITALGLETYDGDPNEQITLPKPPRRWYVAGDPEVIANPALLGHFKPQEEWTSGIRVYETSLDNGSPLTVYNYGYGVDPALGGCGSDVEAVLPGVGATGISIASFWAHTTFGSGKYNSGELATTIFDWFLEHTELP